VVLTDFAWPDVDIDIDIERKIIEDGGYTFAAGPGDPMTESEVEALVSQTRPAAIMTCWSPVSPTAITSAHGLRIVARMGVGLDDIPWKRRAP
jgi:D-3-phosphoglycerate dehydrogenase / 2-oxoglutarate reductase